MNFLLYAAHGKDVNPELAPSRPPPCVRVCDPGRRHPSTPFLPPLTSPSGKADGSGAQTCWAGCWARALCLCTWPGPAGSRPAGAQRGSPCPCTSRERPLSRGSTDHALGRQDAGVGGKSWEWHLFHLNPSCLSASPDSRHGFSLKPHLPPTVGVSRLPLILSAFLRDQAKVKLRTRAPLKHLSSFRPHLAGSLGGGRDATLVVHLFPNPHADIQSRGRHLWISSSFIARAVAFLIPRRLCFL